MNRRASSWLARPAKASVNYLPRIASSSDWSVLASRPGVHTVARTEIVKFVVDTARDHETFFLNTKKWEAHYLFVLRYVDPRADFARFQVHEYTHEDRRFVLGSVMHYLDGDYWTVELDAADTLGAERIVWLYEHMAERIWVANRLRYRPLSPSQIARVDALGDRLPVLSRDTINASVSYQPVVLGVAYGYLRLVRGPLDVSSLRPYDIALTDQVPLEIPPVAALITSELQAPLAHVAVLSRNRNTPDMALRGAIDMNRFASLEGRLVKLTVAAQDYDVEETSVAEAEAAWLSIRPATPFIPERDLSKIGLCSVDTLEPRAMRYVGAKAAQLGELGRIPGIDTPRGFALPFSAYAAHLETAGLDAEIEEMLADEAFRSDATQRAERLARLRASIAEHPIEPDLLTSLTEGMRALSPHGPYIFRSSTNAEDMAGFNGAGLYESTVVPADPTEAQVAAALRFVWASVWLQRAYEEREWYRIDHKAVAMAVLVQPYLTGAIATGVAITGNVFNKNLSGVFINVQKSGATVTSAGGGEVPEQFLVATWTGRPEPELLSRSSLTDNAPILSEEIVCQLTDQLLRIHDAMLPAHAGHANAMDVEFALTEAGTFVFVQARPYTIVYNLDRDPPQQEIGALGRVMYRVRRVIGRFRRAEPRHGFG